MPAGPLPPSYRCRGRCLFGICRQRTCGRASNVSRKHYGPAITIAPPKRRIGGCRAVAQRRHQERRIVSTDRVYPFGNACQAPSTTTAFAAPQRGQTICRLRQSEQPSSYPRSTANTRPRARGRPCSRDRHAALPQRSRQAPPPSELTRSTWAMTFGGDAETRWPLISRAPGSAASPAAPCPRTAAGPPTGPRS